jgi:hypothetical protein
MVTVPGSLAAAAFSTLQCGVSPFSPILLSVFLLGEPFPCLPDPFLTPLQVRASSLAARYVRVRSSGVLEVCAATRAV